MSDEKVLKIEAKFDEGSSENAPDLSALEKAAKQAALVEKLMAFTVDSLESVGEQSNRYPSGVSKAGPAYHSTAIANAGKGEEESQERFSLLNKTLAFSQKIITAFNGTNGRATKAMAAFRRSVQLFGDNLDDINGQLGTLAATIQRSQQIYEEVITGPTELGQALFDLRAKTIDVFETLYLKYLMTADKINNVLTNTANKYKTSIDAVRKVGNFTKDAYTKTAERVEKFGKSISSTAKAAANATANYYKANIAGTAVGKAFSSVAAATAKAGKATANVLGRAGSAIGSTMSAAGRAAGIVTASLGGTAAALTAVGTVVAVAAVAVGVFIGVVALGAGLMVKFTDSLGEVVGEFSALYTAAKALTNIKEIEARVASAEKVGGELAALEDSKSGLVTELIELKTNFIDFVSGPMQFIMDLLTTLLQVINTVASVVNFILELAASIVVLFLRLLTEIPIIGGAFKGLLGWFEKDSIDGIDGAQKLGERLDTFGEQGNLTIREGRKKALQRGGYLPKTKRSKPTS